MINLKKTILYILILTSLQGFTQKTDYNRFVNPFIGTQHEGHTFPGATVPMGMIQTSPESCNEPYEGYSMDHVAGYQYKDPWLLGFTQTHLNGAGCPSMSDILLMPYCSRTINPEKRENFRSAYDKKTETASPGFYRVNLTDNNVTVELTATAHAAYHRYRFNGCQTASVLVDLQYGVGWEKSSISGNVTEAWQKISGHSINGYRKAREWAQREQFYTIRFNKPILDYVRLSPPEGSSELAPRYILTFNIKDDPTLEVMIGMSTTSVDAAIANLDHEISSQDNFEKIRIKAAKQWNDILSKVDVKGDFDKKVMFYTSMYHLYIQPNNIADINGNFRSSSDKVLKSRSGKFYSTLSLWDTYRATHPLYTILTPSLVSEINASIVDHYAAMNVDPSNPKESYRYLPRWALWGKETNTMIGNHAVPVLVDAWLKGLKPAGYDDETLFTAIWESVTMPHYRNHVELIDKYGFIPYDVQLSSIDDGRETVSRLLENIYDDYCASIIAQKLGKTKEYEFLKNRATFYRNVYDTRSGFMRGRNSKGEFKKDIDVNQVVGEWVAESDFTEGNAWHYLFHVQHDIEGLRDLMGGSKAFAQKLDSMFYSRSPKPYIKGLVWNVYGTLGQYWHGNEPCHHIPYLYKYTDQGYKTDAILRYLTDNFSRNAPDGLKGNDDCGQMSAWYIFTCMGFYPVNPCGGEFVIGAPQLPLVKLRLENGRTFTVKANNLSNDCLFVKSVYLNGKSLNTRYITYDQIMQGGELVFEMIARTNRDELQNFKTQ